ncbi:MAG: helix-turn-helix transcriptional regulator [Clostridiales bacterium]|nr:helix-turn-helix transcriptional regulator [Clostridiales bacterium]
MTESNDFFVNMGKRIFERRKYLNLSQEKLAEMANVSPQLLSTAERGTKALRPDNLLKISRALGVSTDFLLTGEITGSDLSKINQKLSGASAQQIRTIEKIIDSCLSLCDLNE